MDVCDVENSHQVEFDGLSAKNLLDPITDTEWQDRFIITDSQRVVNPVKWRKSAVMSQQYRLINGQELYDIKKDPGQKSNIAKDHPGQVQKMRAFYDAWWAELEPTFSQTTEIYVGHPKDPAAVLTAHDWLNTGPPWNQAMIRQASAYQNTNHRKQKKHKGHWAIKVVSDGEYEIIASRWPAEANHPIAAGMPAGENVPGSSKAFRANKGLILPITKATLRLNGKDLETKPVTKTDTAITFTTKLTKGSHQLAPVFLHDKGEVGAYYVTVKKK
jgi:arylsulfatase B